MYIACMYVCIYGCMYLCIHMYVGITYLEPKTIAILPFDEDWDVIGDDAATNAVVGGIPSTANGQVFSSSFKAGYVPATGPTGPI